MRLRFVTGDGPFDCAKNKSCSAQGSSGRRAGSLGLKTYWTLITLLLTIYILLAEGAFHFCYAGLFQVGMGYNIYPVIKGKNYE